VVPIASVAAMQSVFKSFRRLEQRTSANDEVRAVRQGPRRPMSNEARM